MHAMMKNLPIAVLLAVSLGAAMFAFWATALPKPESTDGRRKDSGRG